MKDSLTRRDAQEEPRSDVTTQGSVPDYSEQGASSKAKGTVFGSGLHKNWDKTSKNMSELQAKFPGISNHEPDASESSDVEMEMDATPFEHVSPTVTSQWNVIRASLHKQLNSGKSVTEAEFQHLVINHWPLVENDWPTVKPSPVTVEAVIGVICTCSDEDSPHLFKTDSEQPSDCKESSRVHVYARRQFCMQPVMYTVHSFSIGSSNYREPFPVSVPVEVSWDDDWHSRLCSKISLEVTAEVQRAVEVYNLEIAVRLGRLVYECAEKNDGVLQEGFSLNQKDFERFIDDEGINTALVNLELVY
ncbi:hypothetical protein FZEAL_7391 [Fusarium zealandicum]|uniref:Uncharacterized protein n=1 Tax=Fusarium zealandicum TaxID=1053134 RepID=A0A8H4UGK7_9HYPO|nr:hypothetical protein FZEAL_7391 [Fusarium zealandicum]